MRLGIDIGGTTINMGLVDSASIIKRASAPSFNPDATLDQTIEHLYALIDAHICPEVKSIGIGVPSVVDTVNGIVYNAANIPSWTEVHLKKAMESRYGIPVAVNNDANCFALGAAREFGCKEGEILVGITLGTGVGIGVVADGKVLNGRNTGVGELTWFPLNGKPMEQYCSKSFFLEKGSEPSEFFNRAETGDPEAIAVFEEYGRNLAMVMMLVISAYDPDHIVFGGGIAHSHKYFEAPMLEALTAQFPYPESLKQLRISYLPQSEAAITGASLL